MQNLLSVTSTKTMSSIEIAKLVESRHDSVKLSIERLAKNGVIQLPPLVETPNNQGVMVKNYLIEKRDSYVVVAQLSPAFTGRLVDRWQELESQQFKLPNFEDPAEAAIAWAEQFKEKKFALEQLEVAKTQIESNRPKVEFAEAISNTDARVSIGDFAKVIGTGQNRLFEQLRNDGFLMSNNRPYQSAIDRGLMVSIEQKPYVDTSGVSHPTFKTMITGKGQVYFEKKYRVNQSRLQLVQS